MNKNIFLQKRVSLDINDNKLFPALGEASNIQQNALQFKNALETEVKEQKHFENIEDLISSGARSLEPKPNQIVQFIKNPSCFLTALKSSLVGVEIVEKLATAVT